MEKTIVNTLECFVFGEAQVGGNLTVIPLFAGGGPGPGFLTLGQALDDGLIEIGEMGDGAHVPELQVDNRAPAPVLLLDGEELVGAKQNRVLNTTILLKEHSRTVIPVSCVEQGRWAYQSRHFAESGHMMSAALRRVKNESVGESLRSGHRFASDQSAVWEEISEQSRRAGVHSPTCAMRDVHETKRGEMEDCLESFPCLPRQNGILVLAGGRVVGLDRVSSPDAFARLHGKLVRSYLMDALLLPAKPATGVAPDEAKKFLEELRRCAEQCYASVGLGQDFRYEGKRVVGSALVCDGVAVHMAFFRRGTPERQETFAPSRQRRHFRE